MKGGEIGSPHIGTLWPPSPHMGEEFSLTGGAGCSLQMGADNGNDGKELFLPSPHQRSPSSALSPLDWAPNELLSMLFPVVPVGGARRL